MNEKAQPKQFPQEQLARYELLEMHRREALGVIFKTLGGIASTGFLTSFILGAGRGLSKAGHQYELEVENSSRSDLEWCLTEAVFAYGGIDAADRFILQRNKKLYPIPDNHEEIINELKYHLLGKRSRRSFLKLASASLLSLTVPLGVTFTAQERVEEKFKNLPPELTAVIKEEWPGLFSLYIGNLLPFPTVSEISNTTLIKSEQNWGFNVLRLKSQEQHIFMAIAPQNAQIEFARASDLVKENPYPSVAASILVLPVANALVMASGFTAVVVPGDILRLKSATDLDNFVRKFHNETDVSFGFRNSSVIDKKTNFLKRVAALSPDQSMQMRFIRHADNYWITSNLNGEINIDNTSTMFAKSEQLTSAVPTICYVNEQNKKSFENYTLTANAIFIFFQNGIRRLGVISAPIDISPTHCFDLVKMQLIQNYGDIQNLELVHVDGGGSTGFKIGEKPYGIAGVVHSHMVAQFARIS